MDHGLQARMGASRRAPHQQMTPVRDAPFMKSGSVVDAAHAAGVGEAAALCKRQRLHGHLFMRSCTRRGSGPLHQRPGQAG